MEYKTMKEIGDSIAQQVIDLYAEDCNDDQVIGVIVQRINQLDSLSN